MFAPFPCGKLPFVVKCQKFGLQGIASLFLVHFLKIAREPNEKGASAIFDITVYYLNTYSGHGFPNLISRTMPYPSVMYIP